MWYHRVVTDLADGLLVAGAAPAPARSPSAGELPRPPAAGGPPRDAWLLNSGYYRLLPHQCMHALREAALVAALMLAAPLPFYRAYLSR